MNTFAAWITLLAYIGFAIPPWRNLLTRFAERFCSWSVIVLIVPFLLATSFQPNLTDLLTMLFYITLPTILLGLRKPDAKSFDIYHILTILSIWVPIEPDLFGLSRWVSLPDVDALLVSGVNLPISLLTGVLLSLFLFTIMYPLKDLEFTFKLTKADLLQANNGLLMYTVIGIPFGLLTRFLVFKIDLPGSVLDAVLMLIAGYLLTALPEELLFRGVIQNLLHKRIGDIRIALPIAALIFGLAHANNATARFPEPNWGYVIMATIAGLAYGWVYHKTKKVTASAVTHALVNFVWGIIFTG